MNPYVVTKTPAPGGDASGAIPSPAGTTSPANIANPDGADTASGFSLPECLGYNTARHLHTWDMYLSPRQAFIHAQMDYKLIEADYYLFKQGVVRYFNEVTQIDKAITPENSH